ncbi:MAG: hypothetical protein EP330_04075 [Deltaproteobacteria bacterium]|nr:MAG: hypothetical protein EP330_04075 [Deltaproteobacteria bacterium]
MNTALDELHDRLDQLERSNRRLKAVLFAVAVAVVGCGASTTTANYKTVRAHHVEVFAAGESGNVLTLGREPRGGQLAIKDAAGTVVWVLDVDGLRRVGAE